MILELISDFTNGNIDRSGMNRLIEYCVKIAWSYINRHFEYLQFLHGKINSEDIAMDIIADLFIRREKEIDYPLLHSLQNWQPQPQVETQAVFMLQRIIWNRSEQYISQQLKENDPHFARILKVINYQIKLHGFSKINHFGTIFIIKPERLPVNSPVIDSESFNELPGKTFANKKKRIIPELFDYLEQDTDYYPAIPLNLLIKRIQNLNSAWEFSPDIQVDVMDQLQFSNLIDYSLSTVNKHLDRSYIRCGKIPPETGQALKQALFKMCEDLKDGGIQRGLYDYLHAYLPQLNKDEFYENYRNIFDYLFRILRQEIHKELIS